MFQQKIQRLTIARLTTAIISLVTIVPKQDLAIANITRLSPNHTKAVNLSQR